MPLVRQSPWPTLRGSPLSDFFDDDRFFNSPWLEKKEDNYIRREFGDSSFSRSFNLPANTSEEDIQAKYEEGVLKLIITKKNIATAKPNRSIEIK